MSMLITIGFIVLYTMGVLHDLIVTKDRSDFVAAIVALIAAVMLYSRLALSADIPKALAFVFLFVVVYLSLHIPYETRQAIAGVRLRRLHPAFGTRERPSLFYINALIPGLVAIWTIWMLM